MLDPLTMRQCPRCQTPHPDDSRVCRVDGTPLVTQTRSLTTPSAASAPRAVGSGVRSHASVAVEPTSGLGPSGDGATGARGSSPDAETAALHPAAGARRAAAPRPDERAEDAVGRVLGSYRLLEVIGRGGMGRVYAAEHVKLGRRVALKLLRPEYAVKRDAVARFFQEAKAVNKIRHRNIVDVTDFVELPDGTTFIIMELLEGASLGKHLRTQGPLEPPRLLSILVQVCDALEAAHGVGIVHRDLKPDNIFLVREEAGGELVKLLDFGVAKLLAHDEPAEGVWQTAAGSVVGTPAYMSPEQAAGLEVDGRSDVYALGAIMYELFTGQPVFRARAFGEYVNKHMNETPVPPRQTPGGAGLSEDLERIILRCLAKRPEERYQGVAGLRDDLLRLLGVFETGLVDLRRSRDPSRSSGLRPVSGVRARTPEPVAPRAEPSLSSPSAAALAGMPLGASILGDEADARQPLAETALAVGDLKTDSPSAVRGRRRAWPIVAGAAALGLVAAAAIVLGGRDHDEDDRAAGGPAPARAGAAAAAAPATSPAPVAPAAEGPAGSRPVAESAIPRRVVVSFTTDPSGAAVVPAGADEARCTTPCEVEIDPRDGGAVDRRVFRLVRDGYISEDAEVTLDRERVVVSKVLFEQPAPGTPGAGSGSGPRRGGRPTDPGAATPAPTTPSPAPSRGRSDKIDPADTMDPFGNDR